MHELGDIYRELQQDEGLQSLAETKDALEKLLAKMDGLESSFDRIVERSCSSDSSTFFSKANSLYLVLSASRLSQSRRRGM